MKYLLLLILLIPTSANAEVYILIDSETKEVATIGRQDDAVLQEGQEKIILEGDLRNYRLKYQAEFYTYENGRFVENISKLSQEANAIKKAKRRNKEVRKIERKKNKMAYEALKAEGIEFSEIKDEDFND